MANDQFHIPDHHGPLQEALHIADSWQYSPERQPDMYEQIKAIEDRIHGYRRTALTIEQSRKPAGFVEAFVGIRRPKMTLESLVEAESYIGGELFGPDNRLWLSPKGTSAVNNNLGDWFHVRQVKDAFGRTTGETTLHFETHPTHLNKLHEGRPVELTLQELETLVRAIELYEQRVRERLYPFDQEIFDLLSEIDAETLVIPNAMEERFGKEAVARVIEAYKAQKGL